jgi:hypothetical protein
MGKTKRQAQPALVEDASAQNKPVQTIRYGSVKATIWRNDGEQGAFYTVTVSRSWRDKTTNEWHDSSSFHFKDLPHLAKAVSDAHSWIAWQERRQSDKKE